MCADPVRVLPSFRDSLANLRRVRSLGDLTNVLVNWFSRPWRRASCCGNYGDPGC